MPFEYRFAPDEPIVRCTCSADAGFAEWVAMMERLIADPDFRPGLGFLNDFSAHPAPSAAEIRAVEGWLAEHAVRLGPARWAVVVGGAAAYGMTRMLEMLLESEGAHRIAVRAFRDPVAAETWLRATEAGGRS